MKLNLPLHPSMRHPLTGEPVRALFVDKHGRARYPIMGSGPENDPPGDADKDKDKDKGGDGGKEGDGDADKDKDKGGDDRPKKGDVGYFPADTPRAQMSAAEQLAYDAFHGRKHEQRNKDWRTAVNGKTPEEVAADLAELDKLRQAQMSDGEKALDQAKKDGRREASLALAPQLFDVALSHVDEDRRKVLNDTIDPARVIKEDGTIDTDKVTSIAAALAPTPGTGNDDPDYGGGKRRGGSSSGVSAGRSRYAERHGKKQ